MSYSDNQIIKEPNNEQEFEDKETLVVLQFTDPDDANYCHHFSNKFESLDIGSKNPVIKIGNRLYTGDYTNNIGTYLLFEQKSKIKENEHLNNENTSTERIESLNKTEKFEYSGKTFKKLVLTRLFVGENIQN
jgi:hypothetical protein